MRIWKPFGGDGGVEEEVVVGGAGGVIGSVFSWCYSVAFSRAASGEPAQENARD